MDVNKEAEQFRNDFLAISRKFHQGRLNFHEFNQQSNALILQSFERICRDGYLKACEGNQPRIYAEGDFNSYWKQLTDKK